MKKQIEFNEIIDDIINTELFMKLNYENHHGISRMEHSLNVAKFTYKLATALKLNNYKNLTRISLLHDFYLDEQLSDSNKLLNHADMACINACDHFDLSYREQNAIKSHMFPLSKTFPLYTESWIVTFSDKMIAIYEMTKYKVPLKATSILILLLGLFPFGYK